MKQMYEIILHHQEGEKPDLPSECAYLPYPRHTYQPPRTERVYEGYNFREALTAFNALKTLAPVMSVTLYHGGERKKHWQRDSSDWQ